MHLDRLQKGNHANLMSALVFTEIRAISTRKVAKATLVRLLAFM
jgi:hypothetical protein